MCEGCEDYSEFLICIIPKMSSLQSGQGKQQLTEWSSRAFCEQRNAAMLVRVLEEEEKKGWVLKTNE